MSNIFFPISIYGGLTVTPFDRTIIDPFEDGSSAARLGWGAHNFKRRFEFSPGPLTVQEWNLLRSFYANRQCYDPFWFRDNIDRGGNAQVRFAGPMKKNFQSGNRFVDIVLDEVAAIRALPDMEDIATAAGSAPVLWFDANREKYYQNLATIVMGEANVYDVMQTYPAPWQGGTSLNLGGILGQYQSYNFTGTQWAKTSSITGFDGNMSMTIFLIVKHSATATRQVLFSVGASGVVAGTGKQVGIELNSANYYCPFDGSTADYGLTDQLNTPANTWRSLALTFHYPGGVNPGYDLSVNGVNLGTVESLSTIVAAGPASIGAAVDGSLKSNPTGSMANSSIAHAILWQSVLTDDQIKAVHNLLGYQYGLAIVP